MNITANPYLKETYLSHIQMISLLKKQLRKKGGDKMELQQRINILQEMADVADNELKNNLKNEES